MISKRLTRAILVLLNTTVLIFLISIPYWNLFKHSHKKKELNLFVWGAYLSPKTISKFEDAYNIKVNLHLCTSNEEMLAKLGDPQKSEFDLVFASDYAVEMLIKEEALKKIDKTKLDFTERLCPTLLDHPHDPANQYSLPYSWEVYGIVENHSMITPSKEATLDEIFINLGTKHKVAMIPDPIEAFTVAAFYLHKKTHGLTDQQIEETIQLLRKQRTWVEAYVDYRAKYLITTENCPIGLVKSSFLPDIAREANQLTYRIPKEAAFISIEHIVMPKGGHHEEAAYQFLNHLYKIESFHENYEFCAMFPACLDAIEGSLLDIPQSHEIIEEVLNKDDLVIYEYIMPPADLREAWIWIKS